MTDRSDRISAVESMGGSDAVFLYDGDCAFCSACAGFLARHTPTAALVVPWQFVDLGQLGLTAAECDVAVQWVTQAGADRRSGPAAIAALLRTSTPLWRGLGRVLAARPVLVMANPIYRFIARHRDRMPGGTATCALPAADRPGGPQRLGRLSAPNG